MFDESEEYDCLGETANIIFGTWLGVETAYPIVRRMIQNGVELTLEETAAHAVQSVFLNLFASNKPGWMQKPLGFPLAFSHWGVRGVPLEQIQKWYWKVMRLCFPNAIVFTILRHPLDVFLSSVQYFKWRPADIWRDIGRMAELLNHPDNGVAFAPSYDALKRDYSAEMRRFCRGFDLEFKPSMLRAADRLHVPDQSRLVGTPEEIAGKRAASFSHRQMWQTIEKSEEDVTCLRKVEAL